LLDGNRKYWIFNLQLPPSPLKWAQHKGRQHKQISFCSLAGWKQPAFPLWEHMFSKCEGHFIFLCT
jgi:hypothetical protein